MTERRVKNAASTAATTSQDVVNDNLNIDAATDDILAGFKAGYDSRKAETLSLGGFLKRAKEDDGCYVGAAARLLRAIGEPEIVDTSKAGGVENRVHQGKTIARYPAFSDFFGAENTVQQIVDHLRSAADGGEDKKQVLYLLGPVGGGKSSLGDRLKQLMETQPIYVLKSKITGERSPINESPLGLFDNPDVRKRVAETFNIPERAMKVGMSPWAVKRLEEAGGNIDEAFEVEKIYPSSKDKIAVAKVEPGDENNQDTSVLVGKTNIRKLGDELDQNDTDTYLYSGGFAYGHQGIMEFVEMFKAPLKVLNPMLEATQSGQYAGTENIGTIPFDGLIFAHSNESEWAAFSGNKKNEAILDRINVVKVPYTMRMTEEAKIYQKMVNGGDLKKLALAPKTIDMLAKFAVMSRLKDVDGTAKYEPAIRAHVYDGQIPEGAKTQVPTIGELKKAAPLDEGMSGISTRWGMKALTKTYNVNVNKGERAADPVLLMEVLVDRIKADGTIPDDRKKVLTGYVQTTLAQDYKKFITREITEAFTNASDDMCQNMFDRYIAMATAWVDGEEYFDKAGVGGRTMAKDDLEKELAKIEKPANIVNAKDFRNEVTRYVMKQQSRGNEVAWHSYEKLASVIRDNLQQAMTGALPIIKFDSATDNDAERAKKHAQFVNNMQDKGYTMPMIQRAVDFYQRSL